MIENRQYATGGNYLQLFCVLYLCIWSISPPLQIDMIYRVGALLCALLWFFIEMSSGMGTSKQETTAFILIFVVSMVALIETGSISGILSKISVFMLCIGVIMTCRYFYRVGELSSVPVVVLLLLIVWNVITWRAIAENSHIARYIVRDDESVYTYLRAGIGGYGLIYAEVAIFPVMLSWMKVARKNHKTCFAIGIVWLVSYVLLILEAGYGIAIATTLMSLYILLFYKGKSPIKAIVVCSLLIVIGSLMIIYRDGFRNLLLSIFSGTAITKKINDLVLSVQDSTLEGSIAARYNKYMTSINFFCNIP